MGSASHLGLLLPAAGSAPAFSPLNFPLMFISRRKSNSPLSELWKPRPIGDRATAGFMTSTGADPGGDSLTPEGAVPPRTPVGRWGARLIAGSPTPPTQPEPEISQEATTGEILAVTAPVHGAGDLVVIALEETTPEVRDFEVNGRLWDSHIVATEPESAEAAIRRRRLMQQAGRRAKRNEEDQAMILVLQN